MTAHRSYWLPRRVWLGKEATGGGPVLAFTSELAARAWASDAPDSIGSVIARRIWRVTVRPNVHTFRVTKVPATTAMEAES